MPDAEYYNRVAADLEASAAHVAGVASDILDSGWADEGWDDREIAGRNAARVAVHQKVAEFYKRAAAHRAKAFDLAVPKPGEQEA